MKKLYFLILLLIGLVNASLAKFDAEQSNTPAKADVQDKIEQGNHKKTFKPEGIFTTRYVFTSNALPIKKGENYATANFLGPEIHFSYTDKLNAGVMTSWIGSPIILALKYTFSQENDKVKYALGTFLGSSGFLNQGKGYMGFHWACATIGNRENNISFSAGIAYFNIGNTVSTIAKPYGTYKYTSTRTVVEGGINYDVISDVTTYSGTQFNITSGHAAKTVVGPMLGIAGIEKIGARYSFVFDNMLYIYKHEYLYQCSESSYYVADAADYTLVFTKTNIVEFNKAWKTVIILMPGLRFQASPKLATQIALPFIQVYGRGSRKNNDGSQATTVLAFPAPMLTLFFKL